MHIKHQEGKKKERRLIESMRKISCLKKEHIQRLSKEPEKHVK